MRTCLVLIRDPERTYDKADAERSEVLYEEVVIRQWHIMVVRLRYMSLSDVSVGSCVSECG